MKKNHSVFIDLTSDEVAALLHPVLKRKGLLKDIPNYIAPRPLDEYELSLEYNWEEDIN